MSKLLLELFSEEIPALMQKNAEEAYLSIFTKIFKENEIFANIQVFVGPRRVTIYITDLPKFILPKEVTIKGPKITAHALAIEGFCRSNNINKAELSTQLVQEQLYYVFIKKTEGVDICELLKTILPKAISQYVWPKSMYWGNYDISWVRPLKNILCIFDEKILPIKFGHLTANNITYGHRYTGSAALTVNSFADYNDKLTRNYVIIDREKRLEIIKTQLETIANLHNLSIKEDERLLEEVTGLVEFPAVMIGKIPAKFLKLPNEVLVASMKTHQKYFSSFDNNGNFAPYFLFVSNMPTDKDIIISGNEKVLSARLADALYFYEQDLAKTLQSKLPSLSQITFHAKLGNLKEKTERISQICNYIMPNDKTLPIAASLCKSDLTSEMVGEFPELQGIMGYYYALNEGLKDVAIVIRDHYKPQGPSDNIPLGNAAILALSDKLDSLTGLFLIGEEPSGSRDPYSLRRQALGIIRIILENKLSLDIRGLVTFSVQLYQKQLNATYLQNKTGEILSFLEERAKFYFKNYYDISLINAVLDFNSECDLLNTEMKLSDLQKFLASNEGRNLLTIYKRANNILDNNQLLGEINQKAFVSNYEKELFSTLTIIANQVNSTIEKKDYFKTLSLLEEMLTPISNFFDNVMVKDEDPEIANNRLLLLSMVCTLFHKIAKFDLL